MIATGKILRRRAVATLITAAILPIATLALILWSVT